MLDLDLTEENVLKARAVAEWVERLPAAQGLDAGQLAADLSDLYSGSLIYRHALDALLTRAAHDTEGTAEALAAVMSEMDHMRGHVDSAWSLLTQLAERLDREPI
jgi:hypothetical protein